MLMFLLVSSMIFFKQDLVNEQNLSGEKENKLRCQNFQNAKHVPYVLTIRESFEEQPEISTNINVQRSCLLPLISACCECKSNIIKRIRLLDLLKRL